MSLYHIKQLLSLLRKVIAVAIIIFKTKCIQRKNIIFIYRPLCVGDIVCTFPAIHNIRLSHPDYVVIFGTREENVPLVALNSDIDIVVQTSQISPIPRLFKRFFDLYFEPTTSIEGNRGPQSHPLIEEMSHCFGTSVSCEYVRLTPTDHDISKARKFIVESKDHKELLIAVHAGPSAAVKIWPIDNWIDLTARICTAYNCSVIQMGKGEIDRIPGTIDMVNMLNLRECASLLSLCDLMIGIDSGLLHVARTVGIPAVGIFGATSGSLIVDNKTMVVQSPAKCAGCHHLDPKRHWETGCPNDIKCMQAVTVDQVFGTIKTFLESNKS